MDASYLNQNDYTPVGDIMTMALCFVAGLVLMLNSVNRNDRNYRLMLSMVISVLFAAFTGLFFHVMLGAETLNTPAIYALRILNRTFLSFVQVQYVIYLREPLWMKADGYKRFIAAISVIAFAPIIIDIIGIVNHFGFYIYGNSIYSGFTIYPFGYAAFELVIFYLIIRYRSRMIKQIFRCLITVNVLSLLLTAIQGTHHQTSFTSFAYFIPVIGLMFMFHANPYDQDTGSANDISFTHELKTCIEKNRPLIMICCSINDFYNKMQESPELKAEFFRFFRQNIKHGVLYRFTDGKFVLTLRKQKKGNFDRAVGRMLNDFYSSHEIFGIDYKLIVAETVPEITSPADYIRLFEFMEDEVGINETHRVTESDVKLFLNSSYILSELRDISSRRDIDDERVLVYCQPVFNIVTGTYDTAEALMRLKLPETGLVFPDKFIPIAEKNGLIHQLTLTILNKTCREIHDLLAEGYHLNRISVNFSTLDLRQELFCEEVQDIIIRNDIPYEKVAVEITESRGEVEFNCLKSKVTELQELGIKFYLDDFGTGYSNFERIMELPFDIIKFDRSLLIESVKNDSSRYMVSTFASMFNDLNYSVLFEGVEDERDEEHCRCMFAKYLQGYKYSKPIPIGNLRDFLQKTA
ncbi:MAG: EAL domain-containing protein [Ruminiclostridium sp.]|nr:EAL domain-containing protein [Ruminiclostridium sp.]